MLIHNVRKSLSCYGSQVNDLKSFDGLCRNYIKIRCGIVSAGSSDYIIGLHPLVEWCMGWKRWTEMVSFLLLGGYFVHVLFIQLLSVSLLTVSTDLIRYIALLAISIVCYIAAFTLGGVLFIWFNPSGHDCSLNVFFMVMSLILPVIFTGVALHPKVRTTFLSYEVFPCVVSDSHRSTMLSCNISIFFSFCLITS